MAGQDGCHSDVLTQLLLRVTPSPRAADLKGDIFGRLVGCLVFKALIFPEVQRGTESDNPHPLQMNTKRKLSLNGVKKVACGSRRQTNILLPHYGGDPNKLPTRFLSSSKIHISSFSLRAESKDLLQQ